MVTKQGKDLPKVECFMQSLSSIISLRTTPLPHGRFTSAGTSHNVCGVQNNKKKWTFQRHTLRTTPLPPGRFTSAGTSHNVCGVQKKKKKWTFQRHKDFTKLARNKMTQLNQL